MKLYLISQTVNSGYDTYSAFVVCAEDENDAKTIHKLDAPDNNYGSWVKNIKDIKVEYLGEADESIPRGEILESFHAG